MNQAFFAPMLAAPCDRPRSASEASMELHQAVNRVSAHVRSSLTHGEPWNTALSNLLEVWTETSFQNWDGYGAPALSPCVFAYALDFVHTIPFDVPQPEIGASQRSKAIELAAAATLRLRSSANI